MVAEVGVGWFEPPSLSLLANVVDRGVGAPGVEVEDVASEASGCIVSTVSLQLASQHGKRQAESSVKHNSSQYSRLVGA